MDWSSISGSLVLATDNHDEPYWMTPIRSYLKSGNLLDNKSEVVKVKAWAARYSSINDVLHKRSFSGPYLRCVPRGESGQIIEQVHQGICGMHIGGRSLCHRIVSQGFYWPTMKQDSEMYVRKCDVCQRFGNVIHTPATGLYFVTSLWPFFK